MLLLLSDCMYVHTCVLCSCMYTTAWKNHIQKRAHICVLIFTFSPYKSVVGVMLFADIARTIAANYDY